jgi:hypothetical protein
MLQEIRNSRRTSERHTVLIKTYRASTLIFLHCSRRFYTNAPMPIVCLRVLYRENEKQVYSNHGPLFYLPERPEIKEVIIADTVVKHLTILLPLILDASPWLSIRNENIARYHRSLYEFGDLCNVLTSDHCKAVTSVHFWNYIHPALIFKSSKCSSCVLCTGCN